MDEDNIKTKVVDSSEIGKDGIVLDEETMDNMFVPLDKNDLPSSTTILNKVHEIMTFMCTEELLNVRSKDKQSYKSIVRDKFKDFSEKYSGIMDLILKGGDLTMLLEMLKHIDMVKNNKIDMKNAEDILRDKLANKFVYPNLTKKQKKSLKKQMKKHRN